MSNVKEGDKAPEFDLPADGGSNVSMVDINQGKNVVIYFYPKDDTPGCTQESKDFRDLQEEFADANTAIIGVSKDTPAKHDKFKAKHDLPFRLISDEEGVLLEQYGVWVEKSMYGRKYMGIERSTFLIDQEGVIRKAWNKVKVKGHAEEVLAEAKKI